MSLNRYAPKRDDNEPQIRKRFAQNGWHTEALSGAGIPDLLAFPPRAGGWTTALFVDVKAPKGKLKPAQEQKWGQLAALRIPVYVARTEADVDAIVSGAAEPWRPVERKRGKARPGQVTPRGGPRGPESGDAPTETLAFARALNAQPNYNAPLIPINTMTPEEAPRKVDNTKGREFYADIDVRQRLLRQRKVAFNDAMHALVPERRAAERRAMLAAQEAEATFAPAQREVIHFRGSSGACTCGAAPWENCR